MITVISVFVCLIENAEKKSRSAYIALCIVHLHSNKTFTCNGSNEWCWCIRDAFVTRMNDGIFFAGFFLTPHQFCFGFVYVVVHRCIFLFINTQCAIYLLLLILCLLFSRCSICCFFFVFKLNFLVRYKLYNTQPICSVYKVS